MDAFSRTQRDAVYLSIYYIHTCYPFRFKPDAAAATIFEEVHAKLLGAQPTCSSHMQRSRGAFGQIWEVFANDIIADQQIRTIWRIVKSLRMSRYVRGRIKGVNARFA